jgi:agmatine deiminase
VFVRSKGASSTDGAVDFNFNYWGGKSRVTVDQHFARRILASDFSEHTRHQAGIVSEGGALEVDGEGTLLVCDSSIINDNRNPGRSKDEIESELKRLLGVSKVIWLKGVKGLESTDWHVDAFARFVAPGHVILSKPPPNAHPAILDIFDAAVETFKKTTDAQGRSIVVTICQEPDQEKLAGGAVDGMVTSYVNYLLVNGGVVMAKFDEPETDAKAFEQIQSLFPDRRVVQVYINELPRLGGGIHCATQHIPV